MNKFFFAVSLAFLICISALSVANAMQAAAKYKKVRVPENFYDNKVHTMVKKCKVNSVYCRENQPQGNPVSNQFEGCIDAAGNDDGFVTEWEVNRYRPACN